MVLLDVVMGFRVDGNGFCKLGLQGGDQMLFTAVEELGDLGVDLYCESVAHHVRGF